MIKQILIFQRGGRFLTSRSDVYGRHILTSKVDPRVERVIKVPEAIIAVLMVICTHKVSYTEIILQYDIDIPYIVCNKCIGTKQM